MADVLSKALFNPLVQETYEQDGIVSKAYLMRKYQITHLEASRLAEEIKTKLAQKER